MKDSENNSYKIALFVALACVLQISESLIPHPIPGLRLGLANILTLTALVTLGFKSALEITVIRTILSSFITGTFMSPGFILSFSGALTSTIVMGLFFRMSGLYWRHGPGIIGISIIGAFTHNMVQLLLAYLILIKHSGIFIFFPWLSTGAVVTGYMIGIVSRSVCQNLENIRNHNLNEVFHSHTPSQIKNQYVHASSFLHRLPGNIKLIAVIALSLIVLIATDYRLYLFLFGCLVTASVLSYTPLTFFLSKIRRYSSLVLFSFLLPILFNSGVHVIITVANFHITYEGLTTGALFAFRILFLISLSALMVRVTPPEEINKGLAQLMMPLKYFGVPVQRIASILSLSWTAIPVLWESVYKAIFSLDLKKVKSYRDLIPLLSKLIASFYLEAEKGGKLWKDA